MTDDPTKQVAAPEPSRRLLSRLGPARWLLAGIGVAVIVLAGLATWSPCTNRIALTVRTQSITVRGGDTQATIQAWAAGQPGTPLKPGIVRLSGRFPILPRGVAVPDAAEDPVGTIAVEATTGELRELRLDPGAVLRVELVAGDGVAYAGGDGVNATIAATLALLGRVTAGPEPARSPVSLDRAEPFTVIGTPGQPFRMVLRPSDPANIGIEDLEISELRFSRPRASTDQRSPFRSDVTGGTLRLLDVAKEVPLKPGDPIWLTGFSGHLTRLRIDKGDLVADIVGVARRVEVGPGIAKEDHTPSLLAWLAGQQGLALLWGAVVAVCGVLVTVWKWLRDNLKP